jgi:hypothetical protein
MCFHNLRITSVDRPEKAGWRYTSLSPPVTRAALSQCDIHGHSATKCEFNATDQSRTKGGSRSCTEIISKSSVARQNVPRYFAGYLEMFTVSENCYMSIARFAAEPRLGNTGLHAPFV